MSSKTILWQSVAIFTLFCIGRFVSITGQRGNESRSKEQFNNPTLAPGQYFVFGWGCSGGYFHCTYYGPCVPNVKICDGFSDCPFGNDEQKETCHSNQCSAGKFRCASGVCIDKKYLCDGIKHCVIDGDDETNAICRNTTCPETKYRCLTGACLDKSSLCNGFADCLDGDDENSHTCKNIECPKDKFQCSSGACIDKKLVCDGVVHCLHGTFDDESPELCKTKRKCPLDKFQCSTGDCIDRVNVCDRRRDCPCIEPKVCNCNGCPHPEEEETANCVNFHKMTHQYNASCFLPSESTYRTLTVNCPSPGDCSRRANALVPTSTRITVGCTEGYRFWDGKTAESSCFRGIWQPNIPKCYRTCAPIKDPELDLICLQKLKGLPIPCNEALPEGAIVYLRCKDEYRQDRVVNYEYVRCQSNGQWNQPLFKCISEHSRNKTGGNKKTQLPRPNTRWEAKCSDEHFKCTHYGPCINKTSLCDGISDCPLGNDERKDICQKNECSAEKFRCESGACIDKEYLCDGVKHCVFDADDEKYAVCKNTICPATKYRCLSGACLDKSLLCNGFADCLDGDDEETDTCENIQCKKDKFQCSSGACIEKQFLCDERVHCISGSFDDESPEQCKNRTRCPFNKYQCSSGECIDEEKMCNFFNDCSDDDETPENCVKFFKKQLLYNTSCILPSESAHQTFTVDCPNTGDCSHQANEQVPTFTQITVSCTAGYRFVTGRTSISTCFQGIWKPPIAKCYRTCALNKNPDLDLACFRKLRGAHMPCDDAMPEGAVVYPKCKEYYHPDRESDYPYIRCRSNGQWDRKLFKCVPDCGRAQGATQGLIFGGKPERRGDSPWHVAIYDVSNRNDPKLICGGTIIAPQIIVSAAHCFYNYAIHKMNSHLMYEVMVAKYALDYNVKDNSETRVYKIRKIFTPEIITFTGESTNYVGDIALLWTSERITFSSIVLPACVDWTYTTRFIVPDGTEGKLVGWGQTEEGKQSTVLLAALLPYVNYKNCRDMLNEDFHIGVEKFCAGSKDGAGARAGDSGGGLLFRKVNSYGNLYYLRGIVSNRDNTIGTKETSLAVFTDVAQFTTWIYEKRIEIENEELLSETKVGLKT